MFPARLIVNADDFGISPAVNREIGGLASAGLLTSTTMLVNAPATAEAVGMSARLDRISIGLHLALTQFKPASSDQRLSPILNSGGEFDGNAVRAAKITPALSEAIFIEWSAQVEQFLSYGIPLSHVDSHHHTHTIPALFLVLKKLQRRFGIRRIRISKNLYGPPHIASRGLLLKKRVWNEALRRLYATRTTDQFTTLDEFYQLYLREQRAHRSSGNHARPRVIELGVHPGHPSYAAETDLLRSGWLHSEGFELLNYAEL
jgi:predicted glycoside hydrolase/deacetylase ChbG (UPF0249 family)